MKYVKLRAKQIAVNRALMLTWRPGSDDNDDEEYYQQLLRYFYLPATELGRFK